MTRQFRERRIPPTHRLTATEARPSNVEVTFTDDAGNEESLTSEATAAVTEAVPSNNPATGAPTIRGTAQVGETLTASIFDIEDADGLRRATVRYQWISSDGTTDTDIQGATSSSYTLAGADLGKAISVRVSFTERRR